MLSCFCTIPSTTINLCFAFRNSFLLTPIWQNKQRKPTFRQQGGVPDSQCPVCQDADKYRFACPFNFEKCLLITLWTGNISKLWLYVQKHGINSACELIQEYFTFYNLLGKLKLVIFLQACNIYSIFRKQNVLRICAKFKWIANLKPHI